MTVDAEDVLETAQQTVVVVRLRGSAAGHDEGGDKHGADAIAAEPCITRFVTNEGVLTTVIVLGRTPARFGPGC